MNEIKALGEVTALDLEGRVQRLGAFWHERPAVLVFVRHFG